jgi:outer membrane protein assembly factor BamB
MKDIRHIATSFNSQTIALAEFKNRVQIFDIKTQKVISEFDTILDFGGQRLAISEDGQICICGCWERHGVCAYATKTGKLIWQRKDLKKVQHIQTLILDGNKVFARFEVGTSRTIDINTGSDIDKVTGAKFYLESRFHAIDLIGKSNKIQVVDRSTRKTKVSIENQSFAMLDLDISDNSFAISESAGPLSCYEINSGQLKWRIPLNEDGHFLRLCYNEQLNQFVGISWPFMNGGNKKVKYINKDNGDIEREIVINCPAETEFALGGQILVTSDRALLNIKTGERKNWA